MVVESSTGTGNDPAPSTLRAILRGPLALTSVHGRIIGVLAAVLALILTQVGGVFVWVGAGLVARAKGRTVRALWVPLATTIAYLGSSAAAVPSIAERFGRVPLACLDPAATIQPYSRIYCLANRHYVTRELHTVVTDVERRIGNALPGRTVHYLDAGFPFGAGFPMIPHLSHGDGRRLDLAYLYVDERGAPRHDNGSPIGYFAFVAPTSGTTAACPEDWPTLRWDLKWAQGLMSKPRLDEAATRKLLVLLADTPGIGKLFVEPHLRARLRIHHPKVRFQGCKAARHDDHVHIQL